MSLRRGRDDADDIRFEERQERLAEERAERRAADVEQLDAHGRSADYNWPRSFGGDGSVPW